MRCTRLIITRWPPVYAVAMLAAVVLCFALPARTWAEAAAVPSSEPAADPRAAESAAAAGSASPIPWQAGPRKVDLGHDLSLDLSERYAFLERGPAAKILEKNGSLHNENLLGLVIGTAPDEEWFVVIRYDEEGYVKDDEKVDADELLKAIREGQNEANQERQQRGFEPLSIDGWQEAPHYDRAAHHLVWGLNVSSKTGGTSVNYSTRILGRRGYVSLNLVTDPAQLQAHKPFAAALLAKTTFASGARYEDFDQKTDKMAEYGLGGLILAGAGLGAAKLVKVGLLAKFGKVILAALIAGKKFIVIGAVALGAALKALFTRKKESVATDSAE